MPHRLTQSFQHQVRDPKQAPSPQTKPCAHISFRALRVSRLSRLLRCKLYREHFPDAPQVCTTTIMRNLDGCLITLKLLRTNPIQWNQEDVKEDRALFANWLITEGVSKKLCYTDECGFNVYTARSQGRSFRGERAVREVSGQRGRNLTLCLAVSPHFGLINTSLRWEV